MITVLVMDTRRKILGAAKYHYCTPRHFEALPLVGQKVYDGYEEFFGEVLSIQWEFGIPIITLSSTMWLEITGDYEDLKDCNFYDTEPCELAKQIVPDREPITRKVD